MESFSPLQPVVLSGGSGSRLWPMSRAHHPKQLMAPLGGPTLLQQTCTRLGAMDGVLPTLVVCNEEYRFVVAEQMRILARQATLLLEPVGRNTAPALTVAALAVAARNPEAVLLVMPADHIIQDVSAFQAVVQAAWERAAGGAIVTFGVRPTRPETGYGYIRHRDDGKVEAFVEKPEAELARSYVESGHYLWNSGIFVLRAEIWLEEIKRRAPAIFEAGSSAWQEGVQDGDFFRLNEKAFRSCAADSIDYAVMEKTERAQVLLLDAGWSDVGAWSSVWENAARDGQGNVVQGDVVLQDSRHTLVLAQSRLVAAIGLEDVVVVETADAVLVMSRERAQQVKEVVRQLAEAGRPECEHHRLVHRPWGSYETVDQGDGFQVKRLTVLPGASLSLQMHYHRAEHWVVVRGAARVTRGDEVFVLTENQSTYIPMGTKHRLENPGTIALEIVEVQSGHYLGEDDIVRFADTYKRHLPADPK